MVGIDTLIYTVFGMLVLALICGLLWWLISYCEAQFPVAPLVFKIVRIAFVFMIVLVLISFLLHLLGFPVVRFDRVPR